MPFNFFGKHQNFANCKSDLQFAKFYLYLSGKNTAMYVPRILTERIRRSLENNPVTAIIEKPHRHADHH